MTLVLNSQSAEQTQEIGRKLDRLQDAQADWERRAELALDKGREDLAKGALLEKAKVADTAQLLQEELFQVEAALEQGEADITKLQSKLKEAKAKQKTLETRHANAGSRLKRWRMSWWSMVGPMTRPPFSGELLGPLISHFLSPRGSSISQSRKNTDACFING